jgi:hypothetical protein
MALNDAKLESIEPVLVVCIFAISFRSHLGLKACSAKLEDITEKM